MSIAALDLDLEVFNGPFDLLLTLVLKEEIDLLEVDLAEVVLAYVEHLEQAGELDLEAATEFLVLIAALLELKSRLMLPADEEEGLDIEPVEAAEELLARMLEYHRYRQAAEHLRARLEAEHGYRYRSAPLPPELRRISVEVAEAAYDPDPPRRGARRPAARAAADSTCATCAARACRWSSGFAHLRDLLARRAPFTFDEAVRGRRPAHRGGHAVRAARALQGGRGEVGAGGSVRPDHGGAVVNDLARTVEALAVPVARAGAPWSGCADACEVSEGEIVEALRGSREHYAEGYRGVVLREVAGGFTLATDPVAEHAARRLLARPRTPPLTQAQAECLAIVAYLQPVSRPEMARIRGVASESAVGTLAGARADRGIRPLALRRGHVPHHRAVREAVRPVAGSTRCPTRPPSTRRPEDEGDIRERLLRAGEARARSATQSHQCRRFQEHREMLELWPRLPGLERVDSGVALTFDDGPDPDATPAVLDALGTAGRARRSSSSASRSRRTRPRAEIAGEGHAIALHGFQHIDHDELADARARTSSARPRRSRRPPASRPLLPAPVRALQRGLTRGLPASRAAARLLAGWGEDWETIAAPTDRRLRIRDLTPGDDHPAARLGPLRAPPERRATAAAIPLIAAAMAERGLEPATPHKRRLSTTQEAAIGRWRCAANL